jgi:hypothetical protein
MIVGLVIDIAVPKVVVGSGVTVAPKAGEVYALARVREPAVASCER